MKLLRNRRSRGRPDRKRGIVVVQVVVLLVVLVGFAALTVDVGAMYNTRADLQRTADAAAMASAAMLANYTDGDPLVLATDAAINYTQRNAVFGKEMTLDAKTDVEFGRASYNAGRGEYVFTPTNVLPDAVRVRVRHTADSTNGSVPLYFAGIFGINSTEMSAEAIAMMTPRDIAIVADLSASHNDDSELGAYLDTPINVFDVWSGLPIPKGNNGVGNGIDPPPPGNPNSPNDGPGTGPGSPGNQGGNGDPGADPQGGQVGPTWGWMYYWGDTIDENYDPATDPGLMHFPRYQNWNNADLETWYQAVGYSADEIDALTADAYDGSRDSWGQYGWTNRVAVALGFARWDSGLPGGLWESIPRGRRNNGNNNGWVAASELTWLVDYPFDSGSWEDYIYNYIRRSNSRMARANSDFQYRFGLKTFVNYTMVRKPSAAQTPELADTPHQPMQAVKDAVDFMVAYVDDQDTNDLLSLEIYGTIGRHEVDLTDRYTDVSGRLAVMQAGHYDGWTNMGAGIERAIEELSSGRARDMSSKMIILLTDGNANVNEQGQAGDYEGGPEYALAQAQVAASLGMKIFAVSVGSGSNLSLMDQIAAIGGGEHFHAEGTIEQYSVELAQIFVRLGGTRTVELIQ